MADVSKTRAQLKRQALANLGVLEAGQNPSDEDESTVDGYVDPLILELEARNIVDIQDDERIELQYFKHLAILLSQSCTHEFGGKIDPAIVQQSERALREMTRGRPTGETLAIDHF